MKKWLFKALAKINKLFLPRLGRMDLTKLSAPQKALIAYKYWVTTNALD
jgi:glutaredoxin 2